MRTFVACLQVSRLFFWTCVYQSRRPPSRSSLRFRSRRWSPTAIPFPTKPPPDGLNSNGFYVQFQLLEGCLDLERSSSTKIYIANSSGVNSAANLRASLPNFSKVGPDFSSQSLAQFSSGATYCFSLGRLLLLLQVFIPFIRFWSSSQ